jgi:hypothetical protein
MLWSVAGPARFAASAGVGFAVVVDVVDRPWLASAAARRRPPMSGLLGLSPWLSGLAVVGLGILFTSIGAIASHRLLPPVTLSESNIVGGFNFAFLEPALAVILFYALPLTWGNYDNLTDQIEMETRALSVIERTAAGLPDPAGVRVEAAIRQYAAAVADSEWPAMAQGDSSPTAAAALGRLTAAFGSARVATPAESSALRLSQRLLAKVIEARSARLSITAATDGTVTWAVALLVTLCVLAFAWFFGLPTLATRLAMGALFTTSIMTVIYVIFVLRHPFSGNLGVSAAGFLALAG